MNAAAATQILKHHSAAVTVALVMGGWIALYAPLYAEFSQGAWLREENGHVPFVMAICIGTAWARLKDGGFQQGGATALMGGGGVLLLGLIFYSVGRAGEIDILSSSSQSVVAVGIAVSLLGYRGALRLWFPLVLSFYLIIWPGWALDAGTGPLKLFVSEMVSRSLYVFGWPVAHSGAIIAVGPYELLVADACSGLNSLIALTAVGAVYLYAVKRRSVTANMAVIVSLVPIAIFANIIRVGLLVLLTHHFGYDAGQSFLHETAGLLMFAVALALVFAVDAVAGLLWDRKQ
jgi:exosortase